MSLRASHDELDVSAIARARAGAGGTARRPGSPSRPETVEEIAAPSSSERVRSCLRSALRPTGLVLVDKPAGPSSFAVVKRLRDRDGSAAGTREPSTRSRRGSCSSCSAPRRGSRSTSSGSTSATSPTSISGRRPRRGRRRRPVEEHEPPTLDELESRLEPLSGEVELRVPAASAVKIEGERAYKLLSRGSRCRDALPRVDDPRARVASLPRRRGDARAARLLGHVRPGDRRRARRPLPRAPPHGRRPVLRGRRRRGAHPAAR